MHENGAKTYSFLSYRAPPKRGAAPGLMHIFPFFLDSWKSSENISKNTAELHPLRGIFMSGKIIENSGHRKDTNQKDATY